MDTRTTRKDSYGAAFWYDDKLELSSTYGKLFRHWLSAPMVTFCSCCECRLCKAVAKHADRTLTPEIEAQLCPHSRCWAIFLSWFCDACLQHGLRLQHLGQVTKVCYGPFVEKRTRDLRMDCSFNPYRMEALAMCHFAGLLDHMAI